MSKRGTTTCPGRSKRFSTVDIEEAIVFLTNLVSKQKNKLSEKPYVIPHWELAHQEEIKNSEELLTVIPATTRNNKGHSRILMLKINNKKEKGIFSGKIGVTDLEGNFMGNQWQTCFPFCSKKEILEMY